jgi:hypothetical protein
MLGGTPLSDVEGKLSAALTASLRVAPADRPMYIANHIRGQDVTVKPYAAARPADLDAEISELTKLLKAAVNSASRRQGEPLNSIADYILQQLTPDEGDPVLEEPVRKSSQPSTGQKTGEQSSKSTPRSANVLKDALASRAKATTPRRTVLGSTASSVLPAVMGAFQDEAAKRAAREVDHSIIEAAMQAGAAANVQNQQ